MSTNKRIAVLEAAVGGGSAPTAHTAEPYWMAVS